jgi:hypothetical protein
MFLEQFLRSSWLGSELQEVCFAQQVPQNAHKVQLIIVTIIHATTCARPLLAIATMGHCDVTFFQAMRQAQRENKVF